MFHGIDNLTPENRMTWAAIREFGVLRWVALLLMVVPVGIANGVNLWGCRN